MYYSNTIVSSMTEMFRADEICLDQIMMMKQQEETSYKCDDYLHIDYPLLSKVLLGEPPLHLQQAAFEECAQFINMLCINISTYSSRGKRQKSHKNNNNSLKIPTLTEVDDIPIQSYIKNNSPSPILNTLPTSLFTKERKHQEQELHLFSQDNLTYQSNVRHLVLWRTEMSKWSYRVVEMYGFSRGTVAIAFSNLDRYISASPQDKRIFITRRDFNLMTITCLYIAIKIYEARKKLSIFALQEMSQYVYTVEKIRQMENEILNTLQWKVFPPVAQSFIIPLLQLFNKRLLELSPFAHQAELLESHQQKCMLRVSTSLVNMSLSDCALVSKRPSSVAIAAILISWLECQFLHLENDKPEVSTQTYCNEMRDFLNIRIECDEVEFAYNRLMKIHRQHSPQ